MKLLIAALACLTLTAFAQVAPTPRGDAEMAAPSQAGVAGGESANPATRSAAPATSLAPRFTSVDILIDSGDRPLAAYQFELLAAGADVKIVGVEGGEHAAFRDPPYYDPAALSRNRIIIAAFNTGQDLPQGKTRVARLHLQVTGGEPTYKTKLDVAGSIEGTPITATIQVESR